MVVLSDGSTPPHAHPVPPPASVGDPYSSLCVRPRLLRDPVLPLRESAGLAVPQVVVAAAGLHRQVPEWHPKYPDSGFGVVVAEVVVAGEVVVEVHPPAPLVHPSPYDP